jgi:hypothetical protein
MAGMAYTPTTWSNDEAPAINETNLNKMETGIDEAHDHIASTSNPHSVTAAQAGAAESDHNHAGTYEPADATILKQADVDDVPVNGVTTAPVSSNWAYDHANTHAPSNADNTAANETSHADVVVDADIGVNVAAYDHNHDADYADIANEHAESHTVASHSDTSATLTQLTPTATPGRRYLSSTAKGAGTFTALSVTATPGRRQAFIQRQGRHGQGSRALYRTISAWPAGTAARIYCQGSSRQGRRSIYSAFSFSPAGTAPGVFSQGRSGYNRRDRGRASHLWPPAMAAQRMDKR